MTATQEMMKIMFRAAKLPIVGLLSGTILIALSYVDDIFHIVTWRDMFNLTDKIGTITIVLSIILFIYRFITLSSLQYEQYLQTKHPVASIILATARKGLRVVFLLIAMNVLINMVAPTASIANGILNTMMIGSIGWIALQVLYTVEALIYQQMMTQTDERHVRAKALYTKTHIMRNIATVIIVILTIAAILMSFSAVRNIGISILASAGFLTAMIGLSAQKTLGSIFAGLQLAFSQTIKLGDIVFLDNEAGVIEEITFTYVTIKLPDHRRSVVPISFFVEKPFENWSRDPEGLRASLHFFVDYLMPIEALRAELTNILKHSPKWDGKASKLEVGHVTDRAVQIRIQISGKDADSLSDLRAEIKEKLLDFMRNNFPTHLPNMHLYKTN